MNKWRSKHLEIFDEFKQSRLHILVWGPGDPGEKGTTEQKEYYSKRVQIKKELIKEFPRSAVAFSEDKALKKASRELDNKLLAEATQAKVADVVLILDYGRGAGLEIDHFITTYSWFKDKVYVLIKNEYVDSNGLIQEVYNEISKYRIVGYSKEEFKRCDVATVHASQAVLNVAVGIGLRK